MEYALAEFAHEFCNRAFLASYGLDLLKRADQHA